MHLFMYAHNQLLSSIFNIHVYVCMYVCIYVLQSYEEHETLRVTMKDGRAAGAKLLEGFKSAAPDIWYHIYYDYMYVCTICIYVCMYVTLSRPRRIFS
jgi:hypothetical protein